MRADRDGEPVYVTETEQRELVDWACSWRFGDDRRPVRSLWGVPVVVDERQAARQRDAATP